VHLVQFRHADGRRGVALLSGGPSTAMALKGVSTTYELAREALAAGTGLAAAAQSHEGDSIDLLASGIELLPPVDHPDPAHCLLTGTGLTHLGSAEGRDKMHKPAAGGAITDSMRMFNLGLEGGKPAGGPPGAQPEWFYKGDGSCLAAPSAPIVSPHFALDGSEEPEMAGIYIIDDEGRPRRLGFALANEFSDHDTERGNYLWLAHSKLRRAAIGPELLLGELPGDVRGKSRIIRDGEVLWEKPFLSGEDNMSHSIANLEHHHFKYDLFRRPGDLHVHFFGTATLSYADGVRTREGDVFEVSAEPFTMPLRNELRVGAQMSPEDIAVRAL
jgi:hypothetical protein